MNQNDAIYNLATVGVQGLVPYQPSKPITELERELGLQTIVKLASNENPLGPGKKAAAAIQTALADLSLYPDSNGLQLKVALAAKLDVDANQITLGNGSNEILELIARTFLSSDLAAVFSQFAFAVYPLVTQAIGAQAIVVPAADNSNYPKYGHDLDAMLAAISTNTRVVFIANPNNPTGTCLLGETLLNFIRALPENVICVIDEAYFEYVELDDYPDSISYLTEFPNLIITRTFSKAYGLAGLRIGYSITSKMVADLLNRVRAPFNNNSLALVAAEAALDDQDYLQQSRELNRQGMQQWTDFFKDFGLQWIESVGNFICVDLKRDALPVYEALLAHGVIVRPVANYGLPENLRISIGTSEQNIFCINALMKILDV